MRKGKVAFLAFLILSLTLFLSGCSLFNQPPTATFTTSLDNLEVSFDASGSSDPDGSIVSYDWNFGDVSTGTGKTISHTYDSTGNYQVKLTVTDGGGLTDSESMVISVGQTMGTNQPPEAKFTYSAYRIGSGRYLKCDASDSTDPDGIIVEYNWMIESYQGGDLCDADSKAGKKITFVINCSSPSVSHVKLKVKDDDGAIDVQSKSVQIEI